MLVVQVIADEAEIAELLYYDRDPCYREDRIVPYDDLPPLDEAFRVSGLCASRNEARRLVSQGGAYVQGVRCATDGEFWSRPMTFGRYLLLRKGKRHVCLLEVILVRARVRCAAGGSVCA